MKTVSDRIKGNQQEIARLREANLVKELLESRQAHIKTQNTLLGVYGVMGEVLFLLQVDSNSDESHDVARRFLQKLQDTNPQAIVALSNVVLGWVRDCAISRNQEGIRQTMETLFAQLDQVPPVTPAWVQ